MCRLIGFSAEYVEKMTPAERSLFWMYYQQDVKDSKESKTNSSLNNEILNGK
jgi:hypothetical protein